MPRQALEVADIFRDHGSAWRQVAPACPPLCVFPRARGGAERRRRGESWPRCGWGRRLFFLINSPVAAASELGGQLRQEAIATAWAWGSRCFSRRRNSEDGIRPFRPIRGRIVLATETSAVATGHLICLPKWAGRLGPKPSHAKEPRVFDNPIAEPR